LAYLLDTNIAIHLRDAEPTILDRVEALSGEIYLSVVSVVELEGGVNKYLKMAQSRRRLLNQLLASLSILSFERREAVEYGRIIAKIGFLRSRILDRMIAAQAISAGITLITMNGEDFRDIPGLTLEIWPSPST
jgi:tRNA(fMet)-specific endonuclease VapC